MSKLSPVRLMSLTAGVYLVLGAGTLCAAQMKDIDVNRDGVITEAEFAEFFRRGNYRVPGKLAKAAIEKYDLDGSGVVSAAEITAISKAAQQSGSVSAGAAKAQSSGTSQSSGSGQGNGSGGSNGGGNSGNSGGGNGGGNSGGGNGGGGSGNGSKK